jgi:carboxypeptidase Taq
MGLPEDYGKFPPMGSPLSCSIHESQSRLWENMVGRSHEFAVYLAGVIGEFFPEKASDLTPDKLWAYANLVKPSLIRTEADEVTYSLHIVIRMLLEEQLITDQLTVADLPDAWNDMYEKYLGIRSSDFKNGVMQDIHWFTGGFGYFPTYALGNLYNAMMMESAQIAIPNLPSQIESGQFAPLLGWLRENVHQRGMRYSSPELIHVITGKELSAKPFVGYLKRKFLG